MSQKKQLQRLKLAEDERKLQTKRFVKQSVWKSQDGNHCLMKSGEKQRCLDGNVGAFLFYTERFFGFLLYERSIIKGEVYASPIYFYKSF